MEGTVKLNGLLYNISSKVVGAYHSRLPGKVNIGSDDFAREQFLSQWVISDQRGGIGVDEMDESVHADRPWWTDCITDYDGHIVLPRLAVALTAPVAANVPVIVNNDMEIDGDATPLTGGWDYSDAGITQSSVQKQAGLYSIEIFTSSTLSTGQYLAGWTPGVQYTFSCYLYGNDINNKIRIGIDDGQTTTWSGYRSVQSWGQVSHQKTLASNATYMRLLIEKTGNDANREGYADTASITMDDASGASSYGTPNPAVNFNGDLYWALDDSLVKLNSGRTAFEHLWQFSTSITDLLVGPNNNLLIYHGDATNYYWLSTNFSVDGMQQTNVNDANIGILWDTKAWKLDTDGNWWYSATPATASPSWTSQTGIADIASQIERLQVGRDGDGNPQIYCSTNTVLKIFDFTTNAWISTEVKLFGNQHHGKGFVYWNNGHYLSYGLGVKQYTVGQTGTLTDVGLNRDGGLPSEYNGIITRLADGGDLMLALVDSSLTSGNSQSGLYAFTGRAWKCWWADPSNNGIMNDVIVSSAQSAYAVYFDSGGSIFYIDMPEGLSNPSYLVGTQKYETSGIYLSPWFDGDNQAFQKLSKAVTSFAKRITTTETVVIKYRTDKDDTDRDTGFTTLVTLNSDEDNGEVITELISGAGLGFNSWQYRLDLARDSGTNTDTPDLHALSLAYRLVTQGNWSWSLSLVIDDSHNTTPAKKIANLESAIESAVDIPFIFRFDPAETHFVQFLTPREILLTEKEFEGSINIQLLESWLPAC